MFSRIACVAVCVFLTDTAWGECENRRLLNGWGWSARLGPMEHDISIGCSYFDEDPPSCLESVGLVYADSITAREACCACGGGLEEGNTHAPLPGTPTFLPPRPQCVDRVLADGAEWELTTLTWSEPRNCAWFGSDPAHCQGGLATTKDVYTAKEACCVCGGGLLPHETYAPATSAPATLAPPTFTPSRPGCVDRTLAGVDWSSNSRLRWATCAWFGSDPRNCVSWEASRRNVYTAGEACCVCGGGLGPGETNIPPTPAPPTPAPLTFQPIPAGCVDRSMPEGGMWSAYPQNWLVRTVNCTYFESDPSHCGWSVASTRNVYIAKEACCVCGGGLGAGETNVPATPAPATPAPETDMPVDPSQCVDKLHPDGSEWTYSSGRWLSGNCTTLRRAARRHECNKWAGAKEACCACGGGLGPGETDVPAITPTPTTREPTPKPTPEPTSKPTPVPTGTARSDVSSFCTRDQDCRLDGMDPAATCDVGVRGSTCKCVTSGYAHANEHVPLCLADAATAVSLAARLDFGQNSAADVTAAAKADLVATLAAILGAVPGGVDSVVVLRGGSGSGSGVSVAVLVAADPSKVAELAAGNETLHTLFNTCSGSGSVQAQRAARTLAALSATGSGVSSGAACELPHATHTVLDQSNTCQAVGCTSAAARTMVGTQYTCQIRASSSPSPSPSESDDDLSTGALVGIVVGASIAALLVVGGVVAVVMRKKKPATPTNEPANEPAKEVDHV